MNQHLVAGHGGETGGIGGTGRMEAPQARGRGVDRGRADSGGTSQADHKRVVGGTSPDLEIEGGVIPRTAPQIQRVPQRAVGCVREHRRNGVVQTRDRAVPVRLDVRHQEAAAFRLGREDVITSHHAGSPPRCRPG
jgi:hypothetical protein